MKIALLPTGRTEWCGLSMALGQLFPDHEFYCLPTTAEVESYGDRFPYNGFTSSRLTELHKTTPPEAAMELVSRAAQEAIGDGRKEEADMVVVIDDVELPNVDQVDQVVAVMRSAVIEHVRGLPNRIMIQERTEKSLKSKVSFHLISPMVEAWFFADRNALALAGVPADIKVYFNDETDPEVFVTDDANYLAATECDCTTFAALPVSKKKNHRPKWLGSSPRDKHPKGYLQWLCRAPDDKSCTSYSEATGGCNALSGISWDTLLSRPESQFALLRALVDDLSEGLNSKPTVALGGAVSRLTSRIGAPADAVLRNI